MPHSQALLEEHGDPRRHAAVHADLRAPDRLWAKVAEQPEALKRPVPDSLW